MPVHNDTTQTRLSARRKAIHAAARQLGLSDEERRDLIAGQTGKRSSKDLGLAECEMVLERMRQLGAARPKPVRGVGRHPGAPRSTRPSANDLMGKIEAQLADMGLPWPYAVSILKRVSVTPSAPGVERLEWASADQLSKVVAALSYEQNKRKLHASVEEQLADMGLDDAWVDGWLATHAPQAAQPWRRKTVTLRLVLTALKDQAGA